MSSEPALTVITEADEPPLTGIYVHAPFGIVVTTQEGEVLDMNPALARMVGCPRDTLTGQAIAGILAPETAGGASWAQLATDQARRPVRCHLRRSDGSFAETCVSVAPAGDTSRLVLFVEDISARLATERRLAREATLDRLTGLPTRGALLDRLAQAVARRNRDGSPLTVLFIDVDNFKALNDTGGHMAGDATLARLARGMERMLRPGDSIGRYGGDEFVVVCEHTDEAEAKSIAGRLSTVAWISNYGLGPRVSVSIGIAVAEGSEAAQPQTMIHGADADMYRVKRGERGYPDTSPAKR